MPFVITSSPQEISLSGNPIRYKIRCTDPSSMPFMWQSVRVELSTTGYLAFAAGNTMTISFTPPEFKPTVFVTFTSKATPTGILDIPSNPGNYASTSEYWTTIATIIQNHPSIKPYLNVYAFDIGTGMRMVVEAKEYSNDWAVGLTIPSLANYSVQPFPTTNTNIPSNYKVNITVFVEVAYGGDYVNAGSLELQPDADSYIEVDLSSVVDAVIKDTLPSVQTSDWRTVNPLIWDITRRFYLEIWESIGADSSDYDQLTISPTRMAMAGGIAQSLFAAGNYFAQLANNNSLLTWYPNRRSLGTTQPELLAWYNYTGNPISPAVQVVIFYADGSNTTGIIHAAHGITAQDKQVMLIPVGMPLLVSVDANAAQTAVKYTVQVCTVSGGVVTPLSQVRTYFVDASYYEEVHYLLYLNSFWVPAIQRCVGEKESEVEITREITQLLKTYNYTPYFQERYQYQEDWDNITVFHTGYITRAEAQALQELFIYGRVWDITSSGNYPLVLSGKKFSITRTRQNLHSFAIETKRAMEERFWIPEAAPLELGFTLVQDDGSGLTDDSGGLLIEG